MSRFEDASHLEKFSFLWPRLVDLLKEMGMPFVMSVQWDATDKEKIHAYHLPGGPMSGRMLFGAVIAREGHEGITRLIPGATIEKIIMPFDDAKREIAEMEAADYPMMGLEMPVFVDTMRDIQIPPKEEGLPDGQATPPT